MSFRGSFRTRITLLVTIAVATAVAVVATVAWFAARNQLMGQLDDTLRSRTGILALAAGLPERPDAKPPPHGFFGSNETVAQVIGANGNIVRRGNSDLVLPVEAIDVAIARREHATVIRTVQLAGTPYRMITEHIPQRPLAVQVGIALTDTDSFLAKLAITLLVIAGAGIALATAAGFLASWRAIRPVEELTATAEHVAKTQDLETDIAITRIDEIGRLGGAFNSMLAALRESRRQQRQLVENASHELRTPLAALRTNIDVLQRVGEMPAAERDDLLGDVRIELEELTVLVGELVDLTMDISIARQEREDVRLDQIVERVALRARRRSGRNITVLAAPTLVHGAPASLERAVANLIDNACKFAPGAEPIEISVGDGYVSVRDHGPGIDVVDLPHVFERFYRSWRDGAVSGSGLGLAIVAQIATSHGGTAFAQNAADGGAVVGFTFSVETPT